MVCHFKILNSVFIILAGEHLDCPHLYKTQLMKKKSLPDLEICICNPLTSEITAAGSCLAAVLAFTVRCPWGFRCWTMWMLSFAWYPGLCSSTPTTAEQHLSPPLLFITPQTNPPIRPVVFFKHSFVILHGSVSDQHDGLVTQTSLASFSELQTERESTAYASTGCFWGAVLCLFTAGQILTSICKLHTTQKEDCLHTLHIDFIYTALPGTCRHRRHYRSKIMRRKEVEEGCNSLLLHILHSRVSLFKTTIDWP